MNTKTLSDSSLNLISHYLSFKASDNSVSGVQIPYYNNKRTGARAQLKALVGKGSPKDILEEVKLLAFNTRFDLATAPPAAITKFLVDNSIGIDCSGLAYYILDQHSKTQGKGSVDKHLKFPFSKGLFGTIRARMQPVKNADVETLAHDSNSRVISLKEVLPGDFYSMVGAEDAVRNHIIVFHQIEYQNFLPSILHYTHSIALPTDGEYGHGVRQGTITILSADKPLTEQLWEEKTTPNGAPSDATALLERAKASRSELRRLRWL